MTERLKKQLIFIEEIDRIKAIIRKSKHFSDNVYENDAEHSWHLAMMVILLAEYAETKIDILKTIKMVLIHDIVEIDAGDVIVYKKTAQDSENEAKAAKRIFGLLPEDQSNELLQLWNEFEERRTPEARFAQAVDRLQPVLENVAHGGETWHTSKVTHDMVVKINKKIDDGAPELWNYAKMLIDRAFSDNQKIDNKD